MSRLSVLGGGPSLGRRGSSGSRILQPLWTKLFEGAELEEEPCHRCRGSGVELGTGGDFWPEFPCSACGGSRIEQYRGG